MALQSTSEAHSHLMACLDRAALDPSAWEAVCYALSDIVNGTGSLMIPFDADERGLALPHSSSLGEVFHRFVETGWHKKDFRSNGFPKSISTGFVTDQDLISQEEMRRHPYYAELLLPCGLQWFVGISFKVREKQWGAAIHGSPARGPFLSGDVEKLLRIRDHLSLAAKQAAALGNSRIQSLESAFSSADRGVAALDWSGRITLLNGRADEILRGAELSSTNILRSRDRTLDQRLANLVAGAIGYKFSPGLMLPGPVVIPTGDDRSIVVDAVPMPRDFQALLSGAAALLTLHEVADQKAASVKDARKLFRLTVREAELAAYLVAGSGIAEAAAALGMSVSTARQHVKSIFVKTDTHRQAELVALLARFRD